MDVDDATLMAYLDGELDEIARRRVEARLGADVALNARLETQRRLKARLAAHFDPIAEEPVPERFRAMLDTSVVDFGAAPARRTRPFWQSAAALAATLVLGLAIGRGLPMGGEGVVASMDGALVARGELADALDRQLASAQDAGAPTRVGVSFARADGSFCRTFASAAISGLACREGAQWRMLATATAAPGPRGDYRQAGADSPLILQAAQELMTGEPLDANGERRARDRGWRSAN